MICLETKNIFHYILLLSIIYNFIRGILTASDSGQLFLWRFDREDGELVYHMGDNLKRMRHSPMNKNIIAFGGQENCLKIFDLERQVIQFVEKGLPHDSLELRIPIWISDLGFVPNSEQVVTVGRLGHVRIIIFFIKLVEIEYHIYKKKRTSK